DFKNAKNTLSTIDLNKKDYLLIHYSCESFYDKKDGYSPRITSIAIRKVDNGQTDLFAIHKIAEIKHITFNEISNHYDELEKEMLHTFFQFVSINKEKNWIHWNMRDTNYGFKALEHRARVLGIEPSKISDDHKIDLALLLMQRYGSQYEPNPRMQNLIEKNNIRPKDFLNGKDEATAFDNQDYIRLGMSAASKVDAFSSILNLSFDNKLLVDTKKLDIYGMSIRGFLAMVEDSPTLRIIKYILNLIIGGIVGAIITLIIK
ncbi:MAG: hypothetical protein RSA63_12150, partial [Eubacterium sp.]